MRVGVRVGLGLIREGPNSQTDFGGLELGLCLSGGYEAPGGRRPIPACSNRSVLSSLRIRRNVARCVKRGQGIGCPNRVTGLDSG